MDFYQALLGKRRVPHMKMGGFLADGGHFGSGDEVGANVGSYLGGTLGGAPGAAAGATLGRSIGGGVIPQPSEWGKTISGEYIPQSNFNPNMPTNTFAPTQQTNTFNPDVVQNAYQPDTITNSFNPNMPTNSFQANAPQLMQQDYKEASGQGLAGIGGGMSRLGDTYLQQQQLAGQAGQALGAQQGLYGQQQGLADALLAQSRGQGPNPAQAQFQQNVDQNIAQQAGAIASQRGINPALAGRMAAQQGGMMNQQAAGQSAVLQAQQQLGAQQALGAQQQAMGQNLLGQNATFANQGNLYNAAANTAGNMGQLGAGLYGTAAGAMNAQNANAINSSLGIQGINAGVAQQNAALGAQGQTLLANVAAQNADLAGQGRGLTAQAAAQNAALRQANSEQRGGVAAQNATLGQAHQEQLGGVASQNAAIGAQGEAIKAGVASENTKAKSGMFGGLIQGIGAIAAAAHGGEIPDSEALNLARTLLSEGGNVPGKAKVAGDHEANDVIPTVLSPKEIVLPRSVAMADDAPAKAAEFVARLKGQKSGGKGYGKVLEKDRNLKTKMQELEKFATGGLSGQDEEDDDRYSSALPTSYMPPTAPVAEAPRAMGASGSWDATPQPTPTEEGSGMGYVDDPAETPVTTEAAKAPNLNTMAPEKPGIQKTSLGDSSSTADAVMKLQSDNEKIVGDQVKSIQDASNAAQTAALQSAKIYEDQVKQMKALQDERTMRLSAIDQEQEVLKQDIAATKIDPHRMWNSKDTGGKILASIGLLLSGIGSGMTGQENLAMKVINKAIDTDIEAQKANLGKKENLLTQNYKKYGDLQSAMAATSLSLNSTAQAQIAAAAARAQGPQAQMNAQLAIGQLQQQAQALKESLATKQVKDMLLSGGEKAPKVSPSLAETLFPGRTVNTPNGVKIAKTTEDAKKFTEAAVTVQTIKQQIADMRTFMKDEGRTAMGTDANETAKAMSSDLLLQLKNLHELGVLSKTDTDLLEPLVPDPGAWRQDKSLAKIVHLEKVLKSKMDIAYANRLSGFSPGAERPDANKRDMNTGLKLTSGKR